MAKAQYSGQTFKARDAAGKVASVRLTSQIAESGEGAVYRTDRSGQAAKIYLKPNRPHFHKLQLMLAKPPRDPAAPGISIAWPTAIVERDSGGPAGFLMPEISGAKRPTFLYVAKTRKKDAAGVDWFHLHSAALNVAKVFRAIHELGYVIGDVKPENLLVDAQMRVFAIDTDSFQISDPQTKTIYRCMVGTAEYTPPELMGVEFGQVDRKVEHDNFGLAAIVYLFLFGRHPFSGGILTGDVEGLDTSERIRRGLWQWNRRRLLKPHPGSLELQTVHSDLEHLFRRCFDMGHLKPNMRPTADEWTKALEAAIEDLVWCDRSALHVFSSHQKGCPWCALAKSGIDLFPAQRGMTSSSFPALIARFESRAARGDIAGAATMLDRHPRLVKEPRLAKQRARIDQLKAELKAFGKFKQDLARDGSDERVLINLLQTNSGLRQIAEADRAIAAEVQRLLSLAPALNDIETAIAASAAVGGAYKAADEIKIMDALNRHKDLLLKSPRTLPAFQARVVEAKKRTDAFVALQKAEASGNSADVVALIREHEPVLGQLIEFRGRRTYFEQLAKFHGQLSNFVEAVSSGAPDPVRVCRIFESEPAFAASDLAQRPHPGLKGATPLSTYQRAAAARDAFLLLADQIKGVARSDGKVEEAAERAIVNFASQVQRQHGPIPPIEDGALLHRVQQAKLRVENFTRMHRLAKRWPNNGENLVRRWRAIEDRHLYELRPEIAELIAQAEAMFDVVDGFVKLAGSVERDEQQLVAYADLHPDLPDLTLAAKVRIEGSTIRERINAARARVAGLEEMERAIAAADAAGMKTENGERAVADAWTLHEAQLKGWPAVHRRLEPRSQMAVERLRRGSDLVRAVGAGERGGIVMAWGSDNLLIDYQPVAQYQAAVRHALDLMRAIRELSTQLITDECDDAAIERIAGPAVAEFGVAAADESHADLKGKSLRQWAELAAERSAFVGKLVNIADPRPEELLGITAAWKDDFGTSHPVIARSRALLSRAAAFSSRWSALLAAVEQGNDRRVVELWNDTDFRGLAEARGIVDAIRARIDAYLAETDAFSPVSLGAVATRANGGLLLKWNWNDPRISHALVVTGDRAASPKEREHQIEHVVIAKDQFESNGGASVNFGGRQLIAMVCPAFPFRGEMLWNQSKKIMLHESGRRSLRYRVRTTGTIFREQELELVFDRPVPMPKLTLVPEQMPGRSISVDHRHTQGGGRYVIRLGGTTKPWSRKTPIKLELENAADAQWLEIVHPAASERRIVLP